MEIDIVKDGKEYVRITVSKKGCIRSNVVGKNPQSSFFVLKYELDLLIEGGIMTFVIG